MKPIIKIAIDGREANINSRVGSNVYAFEIINQLEKISKNDDRVSITVLLANKKIADLPISRPGWNYEVFGPQKFWTQWALPIYLFLNKDKFDIFYTPGHYAPRISSIPYISSVMDMAYLTYPKLFKKSDTLKLTKWTEYSVRNAIKVIAISEYTKSEIIEKYSINNSKIVVAYPAVDQKRMKFSSKEVNKLFKKLNITEPYFLFVGTIQPRKNIIRLIEAFEAFNRMKAGRNLKKKSKSLKQSNQKKVKLVLAGKIGWLSKEIIEKIESSPLKNRIVTTGFISQREKNLLYKYAVATCLVGLHEGFGIPPLESLSYGTPTIVSNTTSLPEVVGKAGLLANPNNPNEIAQKMWEAITLSSREKGFFRKKAREQIKKYNWNKSAKVILDTIIKAVE